jgi:hypothetical protein
MKTYIKPSEAGTVGNDGRGYYQNMDIIEVDGKLIMKMLKRCYKCGYKEGQLIKKTAETIREPYVSRQTYVEGRGEVQCTKKSRGCTRGGYKFPGKRKCVGCRFARYKAVRKGDTGR